MSWAKFDDAYDDHPKVARVGPLGQLLHMKLILWSARNLSDGFIPASRIRLLIDTSGIFVGNENPTGDPLKEPPMDSRVMHNPDPLTIADALVEAGLLGEVKGGYRVHDYLDYNFSREKVETKRKSDRKRKRRGGS